MDIQQDVQVVEKELTDIIVKYLKENKMDLPTAQKLAADFLAVLPIHNRPELLEKLKELSDKYKEVKSVYAHTLEKVTEETDAQRLTAMRDHIQQGNIEQAITVAKSMQQAA